MDAVVSGRGLAAPVGLDRQTLSGPALFMMALSASAPLTGVAGGMVAAYGFGVAGVPVAFVMVTVAWALFTVGYVAMARHIPHAGPFYAQIARGLGPARGVAGASVALLAYNAIIGCMFGPLGATMAGFFGGPWWIYALVAWAMVAVLGVLHVRLSAALLKLLLAAEVAVVVAFDVAALTHPAAGGVDVASLLGLDVAGVGVSGVIALTVACFLGVETAPAFAEEARSHRVLAFASLAGLLVLGVLFAVSAWAVAAATGTGHLTGVTTEVFFGTLGTRLGLLVSLLAGLLLVTSMLAAMISVHQTAARYVFVLAREGLLPRGSGRIRRGRGVPVGGSLVQSGIGLAVIALWTVVGADPMMLFAWLAALAAVGIMTLMFVACWAALGFFRRGGGGSESVVTRIVSPLGGMVAMGGLLAVTVTNLHTLVGVDAGSAVVWLLPALVAATGLAGLAWGAVARRRRPGLLLGYGEPEPLAELPHHLVDVRI